MLLRQTSPSCQMLCCKALNLLATHILRQDFSSECQVGSLLSTCAVPAFGRLPASVGCCPWQAILEASLGSKSALLLASPIEWADREAMEAQLQDVAMSALAKLTPAV